MSTEIRRARETGRDHADSCSTGVHRGRKEITLVSRRHEMKGEKFSIGLDRCPPDEQEALLYTCGLPFRLVLGCIGKATSGVPAMIRWRRCKRIKERLK